MRIIREELGLKQNEFARRLGMDQGTVAKHENGKRPIGKNIEYKILNEFNVNEEWWKTGEGEMFNKTGGNAAIISADEYVELQYISTKARAGFRELQHIVHEPRATFRVLKNDLDGPITDQIVIEIDGDSMEPNYWTGTKVRAKEVHDGDWQYLNSGVYAVVYGGFFVVKRVKNSPADGMLTLHSDNLETGGTLEVPLSEVRKVWKILRIVDAPAR